MARRRGRLQSLELNLATLTQHSPHSISITHLMDLYMCCPFAISNI